MSAEHKGPENQPGMGRGASEYAHLGEQQTPRLEIPQGVEVSISPEAREGIARFLQRLDQERAQDSEHGRKRYVEGMTARGEVVVVDELEKSAGDGYDGKFVVYAASAQALANPDFQPAPIPTQPGSTQRYKSEGTYIGTEHFVVHQPSPYGYSRRPSSIKVGDHEAELFSLRPELNPHHDSQPIDLAEILGQLKTESETPAAPPPSEPSPPSRSKGFFGRFRGK